MVFVLLIFQLRRTGEYPHIHPMPHPIFANNRLRTFGQFGQFVRVIEETDVQLQRSMRGATRVCRYDYCN